MMMTSTPVSIGAVKRICEGKAAPNEPIWLQIIQIKAMERAENNPNGVKYK